MILKDRRRRFMHRRRASSLSYSAEQNNVAASCATRKNELFTITGYVIPVDEIRCEIR